MNDTAEKENIPELFFVEPSGYDGRNRITAGGFARFLRIYLDRHPESLSLLHSLPEFTYPRPENLFPGNGSTPITQTNRNSLLLSYPGVDGIKTGYLDESGYNIALTARRGDMRLILVLLGVRGNTPARGIRNRNADAEKLLDYGFDNFTTLKTGSPAPEPVRVWKGAVKEILPQAPREIWITIPKGTENQLRGEITQTNYVTAPVARDDILGLLRITLDNTVIYEENLTSPVPVERGSWLRVLGDSIIMFFRELFGYPVD
jgi:D-alanyl-D-alanine carboxypeptidase (penicillin-binding protein 5/6)